MEVEKDIESLPEDDSWVFESLVNFLHGPLWKLPVCGFIEEKSVVFDPESYNEPLSEDREGEFKKIHEEYKALVDFMLGSFMEDLEVTPEQVEDACRSRTGSGEGQQDSQLTKTALQQLSAAEDMDTFRRIMTRKNIDLQLQSLELLVSKYGELSPALRTTEGQDEEDDFLQLVLRYTQEAAALDLQQDLHDNPLHHEPTKTGGAFTDNPKLSQMKASDSTEFEQVVASSLKMDFGRKSVVEAVVEAEATPPSSASSGSKVARQISNAELEEQKTVEAIKSAAPLELEMLATVRRALDDEESQFNPKIMLQQKPLELPPQRIPLTISKEAVTEEDIERRRDYMRGQRDKLVALKKKERARLMSDRASGAERPKSAQAAAAALNIVPKATSNEKSLAARKALADRLKQELKSK